MPVKDADPRACSAFGQMFNPSRMFSWHRSFTISASWKKAMKKNPPSDGKVVLTNLKILPNEMAYVQVPSPVADSLEAPGSPKSRALLGHQANVAVIRDSPVGMVYSAPIPDLSLVEPKGHLLRLAKFESEDSGVELPSGPNSLSTSTNSEKSFVLHSRDSSCDSGVLSASSSPEATHMVIKTCKDAVDACLCISEGKNPEELCDDQGDARATSLENITDCSEVSKPEQLFDRTPGEYLGDNPREGASTSPFPITALREKIPMAAHSKDNLDNLQETPLEGHPLRKYSTSDSLDEYMDECCKLSEVNQGNAKALGSSLGYLEQVCQLIEKIGQLQEHNLRLQKQVCGLQKEQKMSQLKEEWFLQQCSCSAASILLGSPPETKNACAGKNSRPHSLVLAQNRNVSDLSSIPETGARRGEASRCPEEEACVARGHHQLPKGGGNVDTGLGEGYVALDAQANLPKDSLIKRSESHAWGRMRDLVRKTKGRNQPQLGLSSAALKRSCPQLYRPDVAALDLSKVERNSMTALGPGSRNGSAWPF
ncbi:uncharacterized protein LOC143844071 isoform X2 [Paroedura picta]|uniref:uncharacterized protein LOC143844071 isoform X2 n=1 Tax=Paroedura picta TaxID=143630 RepID=UPI004056D193